MGTGYTAVSSLEETLRFCVTDSTSLSFGAQPNWQIDNSKAIRIGLVLHRKSSCGELDVQQLCQSYRGVGWVGLS